jgi:hypothetical protein
LCAQLKTVLKHGNKRFNPLSKPSKK